MLGPEQRMNELISSAPEMVMPPSFLDQVISWSSPAGGLASQGRPVTVREYIQTRSPEHVRVLLEIPFSEDDTVKKAAELTDEELRELTLVIVRSGNDNVSLVVGNRSYSKQDRITAVEQGTALGGRLMEGTRRERGFLQTLIDTGKIRIGRREPVRKQGEFDIDLADFDF